MATAEIVAEQPTGATAYQFEPGIATPEVTGSQVLPSEQPQHGPPPAD